MVGILSFVWRTGTTASDHSQPIITAHDILGPRIAITAIFGLGLMYFIFIFTTFRRYGDAMDETQNTHTRIWYPEKTVTPITQGVQPLRQVHQKTLSSQVRRHHSYPSYQTPEALNLPQEFPLTRHTSSGIDVGVMRKDEEHDELHHSNRTERPPNFLPNFAASHSPSMPKYSSKT